MYIYTKSDTGIVRKLNEDYYSNYEDQNIILMVIADGMGGHKAGEVASSEAVNTFEKVFTEKYQESDSIDNTLIEAIQSANNKVYNDSNDHEELRNMGTTLVSTVIVGDDITVANVGDSRCYIYRDKELIQVTKDHSLLNDLLDHGTITEEEARDYVSRNVITRSLGLEEEIKPDLYNLRISEGDFILLCSDGLNSQLSDDEIQEIIENEDSLDDIVNQLIAKANDSGGTDNITITLYRHERRV